MALIINVMWAIAVTGIAWCCLQAASRINYITLADGQQKERKLPFVIRLLLPLAPNLTKLFDSSLFDTPKQSVDKTLTACGLEDLITPATFLALRILVFFTLSVVFIGLLSVALPQMPGRKLGEFVMQRRGIFYLLSAVLAFIYPPAWLNGEVAMRHRSIQRELPFVLDLLTLSVEAGMDFMSALQRIISSRQLGPLGEELVRVIRTIQLGSTRRESLRQMARRMDHPDVHTITSALINADEMGVSIGSILRIQADQIRLRRFQRAEKLAHEAPVKLLFPLVAFIFPAVFLVLLGPVLLEMMRQWG
jgi:tight adherence protein C